MLWIVRGFIGNDWLGWRIAEEVFESFLFESIFGVEFNANFWFFDVVFGILLEVFVDFIFGFCCSHLGYHIRMKSCLVSLDKHLMFLSQGDGLLFPREAISSFVFICINHLSLSKKSIRRWLANPFPLAQSGAFALDFIAGPAMSRWTHLVSFSMNRSKNASACDAPQYLVFPEFFYVSKWTLHNFPNVHKEPKR